MRIPKILKQPKGGIMKKWLIGIGLSAVLMACPTPIPTGSLEITLLGIPSGSSLSITLTGANAFSKTITASETVTSLAVGTYNLTAENITFESVQYRALPSTQTITVEQNTITNLKVQFTNGFVFPSTWTETPIGQAKSGGTLKTPTISAFTTFNPFTVSQSVSIPDLTSAGGLLRLDPTTRTYIPYMASAYTISNNNKIWTFTLRRGMKWSDGAPIVPEDWVMTTKIQQDVDVGSNSFDSLEGIIIEKVDANTVRATFQTAVIGAAETLTFRVYPAHIFGPIYDSTGASGIKAMWGTSTPPASLVSSGAFKLKSFTNTIALLERNPFFGEWNFTEQGTPLPYLAEYQIEVFANSDAVKQAFLAKTIDLFSPIGTSIDTLKTAINGGLSVDLRENYSSAASSQWIVFNFNKSSIPEKQRLFRATEFRQAMSHLVNRNRIISEVFANRAIVVYSSIYPVFTDWISNTIPKFDFNANAATTLLSELGYSNKNTDGWLVNSGNQILEFDLSINMGNTTREAIANIFADEAKKIGVKVNVQSVVLNTLVDQLTSQGIDRPFDAILLGLSGGGQSLPLGANIIPCASNLHIYNKSGACLFAWETQMESLFNQATKEFNRDSRIVLAKQIQDIEGQQQPFIYLVSPSLSTAWQSRVKGEYPTALLNGVVGTREEVLTWIQP
jgi:peptide/nickel transport system substrate-binding protein